VNLVGFGEQPAATNVFDDLSEPTLSHPPYVVYVGPPEQGSDPDIIINYSPNKLIRLNQVNLWRGHRYLPRWHQPHLMIF
jgi:hypothetical protein